MRLSGVSPLCFRQAMNLDRRRRSLVPVAVIVASLLFTVLIVTNCDPPWAVLAAVG